MKMNKLRRTMACLLAVMTLLCAVQTGASAAFEKVYVASESAKLYKGASTGAAVLREAPQNAMVTLGIAKSSWCYVKYDGTAGYMRTSDLTRSKVETDTNTGETAPSEPTPQPTQAPSAGTSSGIAAVVTKTVKLYEKARTDASSYCTMYSGTKVTCLKVSGSWARVQYNGQVGYVPKNVLAKDSSPAPSEPTPAPPVSGGSDNSGSDQNTGSTAPSSGVKVVTVTASKFYKRPDTASGSLATIAKGKQFVCLKTSGQWARVQVGSKIGYVLKNTIQPVGDAPAQPAPETTPAPEAPSVSGSIVCYLKADATLYKSASTSGETAASLSKGDKVLVTQVKSGWAKLFTQSSVLGYMPSANLSKTYISPSPKVLLKDWFESDIQQVFARGSVVKVIDVASGKSFSARRTGGLYHVDAEPASEADTAAMLSIYGGEWSWDRKAIWVVIDGTYYAASMNGMGHGEDPETGASNEFDGVFCIHFLNSRTHGTDNICPLHQAAIKQAYLAKP